MNTALLRVMYAPLDYINPAYFAAPENDLAPIVQQAVNHLLIQRFSLSIRLDFSLQASDFSQRLVQDWHLIPQVAWLLGCKLARGSLAMGGHLARLPVSARRFIDLPISCPAIPLSVPMSKSDLELHGARYLYLLRENIPVALGQRLSLIFSPDELYAHQGIALNRSLLTFGFDHAKNTYH